MKVVVIGPGAVGGYYAAKLAAGGARVGVVGRGKHLEEIRRGGLRLEGAEEGTFHLPASDRPDTFAPFDYALLATKMTDWASALAPLKPALSERTALLPLQNGLDAEEILARECPEQPLLSGIAYVDSWIARPGVVHVASPGRLAIGAGSERSAHLLEPVLQAFRAAAVDVRTPSDIRRAKWKKLAWNCIFNPLCVITRLTVGEIKADPALREVAGGIGGELLRVANGCGVFLDPSAVERMFAAGAAESSGNPASRTSMWADFAAGKPTEVDFLNGAVSRRGRESGTPTPLNDAAAALVHALERARREDARFPGRA